MRRERAAGAALAAAGLLFIVVVTLTPVSAPAYALPSTCIVCGQFGGVDIVNNVIMFVPFAAGLTLAGVRRWAVLALAIATTFTVETLQIGVVAGRDANVGDLLMNTIGGMVGIALAATWRRWLTPGPRTARRLARAGAAAWLAILVGTAWGLQRNAPAGDYLGNMPPGDERYSVYRGQVVASTVGGQPIPTGPITDVPALRRLVRLDTLTVAARVTTGSMPQQVAAVALVTTANGEELLALGQRKRDLVFRVRMNAAAARLRIPSAVIPEGFPYVPPWAYGDRAPNDTMDVAGGVWHDVLYATATHAGRTVRQEVALAPTLGWSFFLPFEYGFGPGTPWLTALWIGGLLVPVGYWSARAGREGGGSLRRDWPLLAAVVVVGLAAVPAVSRLHGARWWEWAAALVGLAAGWLVQRALAWRAPASAR